jgi:hypothetical protein
MQNIVVPKSNHSIAERFEMSRPRIVAFDLIRMLTAIDLYDQLLAPAGKIGDIRTNRFLSNKFCAVRPTIAQSMPQRAFRFSRSAAKLTRSIYALLLHPTSR